MKNTAILLFVLMSPNVIAQPSSVQEDTLTKMTQDALFAVLSKEKIHLALNSSNKGLKKESNIWIDYFPAGFELTQEMLQLDLKLKLISVHALSDKQKRKGVEGIGFSGAIINGDTIQFYFNRKYVIMSGKRLLTGIDGEGYYFEYQYSCEKEEWILTKAPE